jgi:hypothetical protein
VPLSTLLSTFPPSSGDPRFFECIIVACHIAQPGFRDAALSAVDGFKRHLNAIERFRTLISFIRKIQHSRMSDPIQKESPPSQQLVQVKAFNKDVLFSGTTHTDAEGKVEQMKKANPKRNFTTNYIMSRIVHT